MGMTKTMIICDFFSDIADLDRATHYRSQEAGKGKTGPLSKIIRREPCSWCGRTVMLSTDSGVNATFGTRHLTCTLRTLESMPDDEC